MDIIRINCTTKESISLFIMSYLYSISHGPLVRLHSISDKLFWTYMTTLSPVLKIGCRKFSSLRESASNIVSYLEIENKNLFEIEDSKFISELILTEYKKLTETEKTILKYYRLFMSDCFSDGESCFHITELKDRNIDFKLSKNIIFYKDEYFTLLNNYKNIDFVHIDGEIFEKTSRAAYLLEKYYGDLPFNSLDHLTVKQIINKIEDIYEETK